MLTAPITRSTQLLAASHMSLQSVKGLGDRHRPAEFVLVPRPMAKIASPPGQPAYTEMGWIQHRQDAIATALHLHIPERKAPTLILFLWLAYRLRKAAAGTLHLLDGSAWVKWVMAIAIFVAIVVVASSDCAGENLREQRRSVDLRSQSVLETESQEGQDPPSTYTLRHFLLIV